MTPHLTAAFDQALSSTSRDLRDLTVAWRAAAARLDEVQATSGLTQLIVKMSPAATIGLLAFAIRQLALAGQEGQDAMSWEADNPVAVVDEEADPPVIVTRYQQVAQAEWFLGYLREHGGSVLRDKVDRGGYGIDAPEGTP